MGTPQSGGVKLLLVGLTCALLGGGVGFFLGLSWNPLTAAPPTAEPAPGVATLPDIEAPGSPTTAVAPDGGTVTSPGAGGPTAGDGGAPGDDRQRLTATISGSLYQTLSSQLDGRQADILSAQLSRLLVWWLNPSRDVLKDDRIQVLFEPMPGPGELRILALRFTSGKHGRTYQAVYFQRPDTPYGRYYDETGREIEKRLVDGPLKEYEQVTELMNLSGRRHRGVDFKCDVDTPIYSPRRARVLRRNWGGRGNGNCLELQYLDTGTVADFLHLAEGQPSVRPGQVVEAGQEVARSGNTGRSTAPHLHYQLQSAGGKLLNPFEFHATERRELKDTDLEAFQAASSAFARLLDAP